MEIERGRLTMPESKPKRRWYHITPDRLIIGLLAVEGLLLLSEWSQWFAFNEKKGYTVLIAVAAVCFVIVVMLLWLATSLLFRWRFQFSLRSLVVLVVAVAVPCCWLATIIQEAEEQKRAVEAIERAGGRIFFDNQVRDDMGRLKGEKEPPAPLWFRKLVGDDFYRDAVAVDLLCSAVDDERSVEHLKSLTKLEALTLAGTKSSDTALEHITGLRNLKYLVLRNTQVTDNGLKHLKGLADLGSLELYRPQVTDDGLAHLKGHVRLWLLVLNCPQVTDDGVVHLKGLSNLKALSVSDTQVTSEGIKELEEALPECEIHWTPPPTPKTTHDQP